MAGGSLFVVFLSAVGALRAETATSPIVVTHSCWLINKFMRQ